MLEKARAHAKDLACWELALEGGAPKRVVVAKELLLAMKWSVHTKNTFPTAAGLASSASGLSCLAFLLGRIYSVPEAELSSLARLGSGSACRSILGGFVRWERGFSGPLPEDAKEEELHISSRAVQVQPASFWPELRVFVVQLESGKKLVSSSEGMRLTAQTSELYRFRQQFVV